MCVCLFPIYIYIIYSSFCAEQLLIKAWTYLNFWCLQWVPRQTARCKGYFGSLPETMLSLFMSIAGGVSWQDTWCRHAVPTLQLTLDCWRPIECTPHVNAYTVFLHKIYPLRFALSVSWLHDQIVPMRCWHWTAALPCWFLLLFTLNNPFSTEEVLRPLKAMDLTLRWFASDLFGCFLKWSYPPNTPKWSFFLY